MLNEFWREYLENNQERADKKIKSCVCFGSNERDAEAACIRIRNGAKRAEIYPKKGYRCALNGAPEPGDLNIITNWKGEPAALVETTGVRVVRIAELSNALCALEGDCATVEEWNEKRLPNVRQEAEELGIDFDGDMELIVEEFHLIYVGREASV